MERLHTFADMQVPTARADHGNALSQHGAHWQDEYAWLRDAAYPDLKDPQVRQYLEAENTYFEAYFGPYRESVQNLVKELRSRIPNADSGVPWQHREFYYRWQFEADAEYRRWQRAPRGTPDAFVTFLDEPALAAGLSYFDLGAWTFAPNERQLAYAYDDTGDERYTLAVTEPGADEPLVRIENTIGEPVWTADGSALYYLELDAEWRPARVFRLNWQTGKQTLIYAEPDPGFRLGIGTDQAEQLLLIASGDHITSEVLFLPLDSTDTDAQVVIPRRIGHDYDVDHNGTELIIRSNRQHENYGLYRASLTDWSESAWKPLRLGDADCYITGHCAFQGLTAVTERHRGLDQILLLDSDGREQRIEFPDATYVAQLGMNAQVDPRHIRISYESLTQPRTVFDYDLGTGTLQSRKIQTLPSGYESSQYRAERLTITARDGTDVPVSLVYGKDTPPGPERPLYLYGYGAYGYAIAPGFSSARLSLLDRGISFAIAHVRGGDDLGYHWYTAGRGPQRMNTFNDFVDVARGLVDRQLTGRGRLAMVGGSAGGELVGAALNQDPTLCGVAVLQVPFVDVLNTMLDATLPLTPIEWPEWGNPIDDPEAFALIMSYSPYEQIQAAPYPPMLVTAGLNDPRVTYWEPAKYVARLRARRLGTAPLLLKTVMDAGHSGASGRFDSLLEVAEEYQFIFNALLPAAET